jgi:chromatin remodeling complex protein RSC6
MPRKSADNTTKTEKSSKKSKKAVKDEPVDTVKEDVVVEETVEEDVVAESEPPVEEAVVDVEAAGDVADKPAGETTVVDSFDEIIKLVDDEIEAIRSGSAKTTGVKFLRSINKRLKLLKTKASKAAKTRKTTRKPSTNTNSGFLKPVQISKEMAKFTGWDPLQSKSRVDVTKYICKYIKDNDLQNPKDRREILADDKLKKLLNYDSKKDEKLTYYKIQSYLKPHFTAIPTPKA